MITLVYGPDGEDVNDFNYEEWIKSVIEMDWANEDITIRVSDRRSVLLVQIAILKEDILHDFVQFTTIDEIEAYWKPTGFNRYGQPLQGMVIFELDNMYKLVREFNTLKRVKEAKDAKVDPNQENLF